MACCSIGNHGKGEGGSEREGKKGGGIHLAGVLGLLIIVKDGRGVGASKAERRMVSVSGGGRDEVFEVLHARGVGGGKAEGFVMPRCAIEPR